MNQPTPKRKRPKQQSSHEHSKPKRARQPQKPQETPPTTALDRRGLFAIGIGAATFILGIVFGTLLAGGNADDPDSQELVALGEERDRLENDLADLVSRERDAAQRVQVLEQELRDTGREGNTQQGRRGADADVERIRSELEEARREAEAAQREADAARRVRENAQRELAQAREQLAEYEREREQERQRAQDERERAESEADARASALRGRQTITPAEYEQRLERYRDRRARMSSVEAEAEFEALRDGLMVEVAGEVNDVVRRVDRIPHRLMEAGEVVVVLSLQGPEQTRARFPNWRETVYMLVPESRVSEFRRGSKWRLGLLMEAERIAFGTHCLAVHTATQREIDSIVAREREYRATRGIEQWTEEEEKEIIEQLYSRLLAAEREKGLVIHPARAGMHIKVIGRAE